MRCNNLISVTGCNIFQKCYKISSNHELMRVSGVTLGVTLALQCNSGCYTYNPHILWICNGFVTVFRSVTMVLQLNF